MNDGFQRKDVVMSRARITLPTRLTGIARVREAPPAATPTAVQPAPTPPPAPPTPPRATDDQVMNQLANELSKLSHVFQARDCEAAGAIARAAVHLGVTVADRLLGEAVAVDRQRLDRTVRAAL